jgi:hypothetical protein
MSALQLELEIHMAFRDVREGVIFGLRQAQLSSPLIPQEQTPAKLVIELPFYNQSD